MNTYAVVVLGLHAYLALLLFLYFLPAARRQRAARSKRFDEWLKHEVFPSARHNTPQPATPAPPKPLLSPKAKKILGAFGTVIKYLILGVIVAVLVSRAREKRNCRGWDR